MWEFFRVGGSPMYFIAAFGFALIAASVLYALRPGHQQWPLLASLALSTLACGVMGFALGLMMTFRYIQKVPAANQFTVSALGFSESITNLILSLMLITVSGLLVSIGLFRASPESR